MINHNHIISCIVETIWAKIEKLSNSYSYIPWRMFTHFSIFKIDYIAINDISYEEYMKPRTHEYWCDDCQDYHTRYEPIEDNAIVLAKVSIDNEYERGAYYLLLKALRECEIKCSSLDLGLEYIGKTQGGFYIIRDINWSSLVQNWDSQRVSSLYNQISDLLPIETNIDNSDLMITELIKWQILKENKEFAREYIRKLQKEIEEQETMKQQLSNKLLL